MSQQTPSFPQALGLLNRELDELPLTRVQRGRIDFALRGVQQAYAAAARGLQQPPKAAKAKPDGTA